MGEVFKFQQEEDCQCEEVCQQCQRVQDYLEQVLEWDTPEEVHDLLKKLSDGFFEEGFKSALIQDIYIKQQMLDDME